MAYLPDETGYVKKRILIRKGFMEDHLDELSAIVRGENHRDIMAYVRGWASNRQVQDPGGPNPGSPEVPEPEPEPAVRRPGPVPKEIDEELFAILWETDAPSWALERIFGLTYVVLWKRAKDRGFPKRRRGAILKLARQHGGP